jgi:hypothetical protein
MIELGSKLWKVNAQNKWSGKPKWEEYDVREQTSRSWIVMPTQIKGCSEGNLKVWGIKIPKNAPMEEVRRAGFRLSEEEVQLELWTHTHQHKILRAVEQASPEVLREIAKLIGYKEE